MHHTKQYSLFVSFCARLPHNQLLRLSVYHTAEADFLASQLHLIRQESDGKERVVNTAQMQAAIRNLSFLKSWRGGLSIREQFYSVGKNIYHHRTFTYKDH